MFGGADSQATAGGLVSRQHGTMGTGRFAHGYGEVVCDQAVAIGFGSSG